VALTVTVPPVSIQKTGLPVLPLVFAPVRMSFASASWTSTVP
jgi:hypothetical protein